MSIELVMPSNHFILCHPLLFPSSIFPSIKVFMSQFSSGGQSIGVSASASVLPMNIQNWFLLGLTSLILLSKGPARVFSSTTVQKRQFFSAQAFLMVQLSYPYVTTGKTIALTRWTFVSKLMYLFFNTMFRFVIAFLPRSKYLLI